MEPGKWQLRWVQARPILIWLVLPLMLGLFLSALIPRPVIGVIYLDTAIDSYSGRSLIAQLDYARQHPEVRAVVLALDSPGGTVADTEAVYQELLRLRQSIPVVSSVGSMAASGAYYLAAGTDTILVNPTSVVGNVGVLGSLPERPTISEDILSTGPYKLWGEPRDQFQRELEMVKQSFYRVVELGRGDRLMIEPQEVLTGRIWLGTEAVRLGLADGLGSFTEAVETAADLARVAGYRVLDLRTVAVISGSGSQFYYQYPDGTFSAYPSQPGLYLLYIAPDLGPR
jgi:protease-4